MEKVKIYDRQRNEYSKHTSVKDLYTFIMDSYCECEEGYDKLDEKDGKLKCENCWALNNLEKVSEEDMLEVLNMYGYEVVDTSIDEDEEDDCE